jgi:tetratricopeptide (TPR) repeat protein
VWSSAPDISATTSGESYRSLLDPDERIAIAKKRRSYIHGIRKGDFYSLRNAPEEALSHYLTIQEKLPKDQVVRKKTAHVYFLMKRWADAYATYIQVPLSELSESEEVEMLSALFFDETRIDRLSELSRLDISSGSLDYYRVVDTCYTTVHDCIVRLQGYSGSSARVIELRDQITAATKITDDYQYRNLLVAAKFYTQGMYRATDNILGAVLAERADYSEVKKMLGFALAELGKYEAAKKYLLEYLDKNPEDTESIIRMGEITAKLGDLISSNLYMNNAIASWYEPRTDLERRLAYNYSLLWDTVGVIKVVNYLLQESDATEDDFAVGISLALNDGQYTRAESWSRAWLEKYSDSPMIIPLHIQSLRLQGQLEEARSFIESIDASHMQDNPSYLLEKAIVAYAMGHTDEARSLFASLLELDEWPEIREEAELYLSQMNP